MPHINRIISQNNEILKQQIMITTRLEAIESRLGNVENKYESEKQLDGFKIDQMDSLEDFDFFLNRLQKDKTFKSKMVSIPT